MHRIPDLHGRLAGDVAPDRAQPVRLGRLAFGPRAGDGGHDHPVECDRRLRAFRGPRVRGDPHARRLRPRRVGERARRALVERFLGEASDGVALREEPVVDSGAFRRDLRQSAHGECDRHRRLRPGAPRRRNALASNVLADGDGLLLGEDTGASTYVGNPRWVEDPWKVTWPVGRNRGAAPEAWVVASPVSRSTSFIADAARPHGDVVSFAGAGVDEAVGPPALPWRDIDEERLHRTALQGRDLDLTVRHPERDRGSVRGHGRRPAAARPPGLGGLQLLPAADPEDAPGAVDQEGAVGASPKNRACRLSGSWSARKGEAKRSLPVQATYREESSFDDPGERALAGLGIPPYPLHSRAAG